VPRPCREVIVAAFLSSSAVCAPAKRATVGDPGFACAGFHCICLKQTWQKMRSVSSRLFSRTRAPHEQFHDKGTPPSDLILEVS
jgi:hypothetical protein